MTNVFSALATAVATTLHANVLLSDAWSFPYPPDAWIEPVEETHCLVSEDGRRIDVMVVHDARDTVLYRPDQPGYADHKAVAVRQGMAATGIRCPFAWETQERANLLAGLRRAA